MANLQYIFSSFLLIIPFIIAGIIEAVYDSLFLKFGKVLNLTNKIPDDPLGLGIAVNGDTTFRSVFLYDAGGTNARYLIGSNNPNVFFATDAGATPTRLSDYKNRLEAKFTGANNGLAFDIYINGKKQTQSGQFQNKREYLYNQYVLYQYNYGQWLAAVLVGVFGITLARILNKEITVANIVQASKKYRIGLFGIDTSMEAGGGVTIIKALKTMLNLPGWIISFFVFPTSNLMFFISSFVIFLTFVISFGIAVGKYHGKESFTGQWKTAAACTFIGVIVLFIALRYYSDKTDPDSVRAGVSSNLTRTDRTDIDTRLAGADSITKGEAARVYSGPS